MTNLEKRVVGLTVLAHALSHFFEQAFPPILKLVAAEYSLDLSGAGMLGNVFPFFFGLGAVPAGMVVDRFGSRKTMITFLLSVAAMGIVMLLMKPIYGVAALMLVMGMAAGLYHPAGLALLSKNMKRIGEGMGLHGVGGSLGLAFGPLIAATIAGFLNWRAAYAALAIPSMLLLAWVLLDTELWKNDHGHQTTSANNDGAKTADEIPIPWRALVLLCVLQIFNGFCYRGLLTFFPTFFGARFGSGGAASEVIAGGSITTAVLLIGIVGQYIGGRAADRFNAATLYAVSFTLSTPILFALGSLGNMTALASAGVFAFIYFMSQPAGNKLIAEFTPPRIRGRAYGTFFFANFGIGSFSSSISGHIGQRFGVDKIFIFLGATLLLASLTAWVMVAFANPKTSGASRAT